jgi:hypothetical protein
MWTNIHDIPEHFARNCHDEEIEVQSSIPLHRLAKNGRRQQLIKECLALARIILGVKNLMRKLVLFFAALLIVCCTSDW